MARSMRRFSITLSLADAATLTRVAMPAKKSTDDLCGELLESISRSLRLYWSKFDRLVADESDLPDDLAGAGVDLVALHFLGSALAGVGVLTKDQLRLAAVQRRLEQLDKLRYASAIAEDES